MTATPGSEFTFVDLFAGIGGIRQAFRDEGGRCVMTSEWNKYARQTYDLNFEHGPDHLFNGDITEIVDAKNEVPDHDILLGGFPCQPFSIAGVSKKNALGRLHGFQDPTQGTLFFDVKRIIDAKRPQAFLLENVKNLRSHDKGRTFEVIMQTLENELGYHVQTQVVNGIHWRPQNRERILIVGFRKPTRLLLRRRRRPTDGRRSNPSCTARTGPTVSAPRRRSLLRPRSESPSRATR